MSQINTETDLKQDMVFSENTLEDSVGMIKKRNMVGVRKGEEGRPRKCAVWLGAAVETRTKGNIL